MIKYPEFPNRGRFYPTKQRKSTDNWGNITVHQEFEMTPKYRQYLHDKREYEREYRLKVMREKLEYQMRTYGEVDEIDFNEYVNELNRG